MEATPIRCLLSFVHEIGNLISTNKAWASSHPFDADVEILPRVIERHPQFNADDLRSAWRHAWKMMTRIGTDPPQIMAVGYDPHGRLVEMIAIDLGDGRLAMYHANNAQKKFLHEMGFSERRIRTLIGRR